MKVHVDPLKHKSIVKKLNAHKDESIQRLVVGMFYLAVLALAISISRYTYTGWLPSYGLHVVAFIIMFTLFVRRKKISSQFSISTIIFMAAAISTSGLMIFGIYSNSALWGVFTLFLAINYWPTKYTVLLGTFILTIFFMAAFRFTYFEAPFPADTELYLSQWRSWFTVLFGSSLFMVLIAHVIRNHQKLTESLLLDLEHKHEEVEYLANYDHLTGLPVFRLFLENLKYSLLQKKREKRFISVLFIDLDDFKKINDSHGHDAGDVVLKNVATRIQDCIREEDMAARMGGDEFVVLVNSGTPVNLNMLCKRIIDEITEPLDYKEHKLVVGVSIGAALLDQASQLNEPEKLISLADQAMYQVKRMGKNDFFINHY